MRDPTFMGPEIGFKLAVIVTERTDKWQKKMITSDENVIGFWHWQDALMQRECVCAFCVYCPVFLQCTVASGV